MLGRRRAAAVGALAAVTGLVLSPAPARADGLSVTDLEGSLTAGDLAQSLAGEGVTISEVEFSGASTSAGMFTGGGTGPGGVVGFDTGVVLSTGSADVGSANRYDDATGWSSRSGDPELDALGAGTTKDSTSLAFDVVPDRDTLYFNYVFASEEYNEYVYRGVSDVFGFFVTRYGEVTPHNCAVVDDGPDRGSGPDPVSVDSVNGGNPFGDANAANPSLFRDNARAHGAPIQAEPDGFTVVLQCVASVTPHQVNRLHLAVGDVGDGLLDSWVFLQAGSITTSPEVCGNGLDDDGDGVVDGDCLAQTPSGSSQEVGGTVAEGSPATLHGSATSPHGRLLTTWWSSVPAVGADPGARCTFTHPTSLTTSVTCNDDGRFALTLSAAEGSLAPARTTTVLQVDNVAPRVRVTSPSGAALVTSAKVEVVAEVTDPGANDVLGCTVRWGDRTASTGVLEQGTCRGRHTYDVAGSHDIRVTVTDDDGASGSDQVTVMVTGRDRASGNGFVLEEGATGP